MKDVSWLSCYKLSAGTLILTLPRIIYKLFTIACFTLSLYKYGTCTHIIMSMS